MEESEANPFVGGEVGHAASERAAALVGQTVVDRYRLAEFFILAMNIVTLACGGVLRM